MTNLNALADILLNAGNQIKELMNESPAEWPYKDGDWVYVKSSCKWIIKFSRIDENKFIYAHIAYALESQNLYDPPTRHVTDLNSIKSHRPASPDEIALAKSYLPEGHLDKEQPKQLPSTIEEIVEVVKPLWWADGSRIIEDDRYYISHFPIPAPPTSNPRRTAMSGTLLSGQIRSLVMMGESISYRLEMDFTQ